LHIKREITMRCCYLSAFLLVSSVVPLVAQSAAEREEVLQPVKQLFDGMRKRDSAMVRATFAPDARFARVQERDGQITLQFHAPDDFVKAVGSAPSPPWDERVYEPEVRIDGRVATVWTKYDFLAGDKWSHCGVDAFQLAKLADGWKITQLADTRQTTGCTTPAAPKQ
jgi:hypothetical protein